MATLQESPFRTTCLSQRFLWRSGFNARLSHSHCPSGKWYLRIRRAFYPHSLELVCLTTPVIRDTSSPFRSNSFFFEKKKMAIFPPLPPPTYISPIPPHLQQNSKQNKMLVTIALLCTALAKYGSDDVGYDCPSPTTGVHAACEVTATVNGSCADAQAEVLDRLKGTDGWMDPHKGSYNITSATSDLVMGSHLRDVDPNYMDHFILHFVNNTAVAKAPSCNISSCSKTTNTSIVDYSLNYCNVYNLYCGSDSGCPYVKHNFLNTSENFGNCVQHKKSTCKTV